MHRGSIQSQGGNIEDSEKWNFQLPISRDTAKNKVDILKSRHAKREQKGLFVCTGYLVREGKL